MDNLLCCTQPATVSDVRMLCFLLSASPWPHDPLRWSQYLPFMFYSVSCITSSPFTNVNMLPLLAQQFLHVCRPHCQSWFNTCLYDRVMVLIFYLYHCGSVPSYVMYFPCNPSHVLCARSRWKPSLCVLDCLASALFLYCHASSPKSLILLSKYRDDAPLCTKIIFVHRLSTMFFPLTLSCLALERC